MKPRRMGREAWGSVTGAGPRGTTLPRPQRRGSKRIHREAMDPVPQARAGARAFPLLLGRSAPPDPLRGGPAEMCERGAVLTLYRWLRRLEATTTVPGAA
jgi:hypothetical protein